MTALLWTMLALAVIGFSAVIYDCMTAGDEAWPLDGFDDGH